MRQKTSLWAAASGTACLMLLGGPAQATPADGGRTAISRPGEGGTVALTADLTIRTTTAGPDGERNSAETKQRFHRDSQGRTRLESGTTVTISDPAARTTTHLDVAAHSYRRTAAALPEPGPAARKTKQDMLSSAARPLGSRTMQGLAVEGQAQVVTMPSSSGRAAERREVTTWHSRTLRLPVQTRIVAASGAETVQTYSNIRTGEPEAGLFAVPAGYREAGAATGAAPAAATPDTTPCPIFAPDSVPLVSFGPFLGAAVVEATTDGAVGCRFVDSYGYAEPPIRGFALTGTGKANFQWYVYDDGGPVPFLPWFAYGVIEWVAARDGVAPSYFQTLLVLYIDY